MIFLQVPFLSTNFGGFLAELKPFVAYINIWDSEVEAKQHAFSNLVKRIGWFHEPPSKVRSNALEF